MSEEYHKVGNNPHLSPLIEVNILTGEVSCQPKY
jgi:hypothetical protein